MVFKKMLSAMGVGGPSVDTVLHNPRVQPGGILEGQVHVQGGSVDVAIEYVSLGLQTRVEVESGDHEFASKAEFFRAPVAGAFQLAAGARHSVPFQFAIPWETPVTEVYGRHLRGMTMGLRTELAVAGAVDKGDLDPVAVTPLPSQLRVLEAFENQGFRFKGADLETGRLHGVHQTLPFFQEIEFYPPSHLRGVNEVEVTFVASPHGLDVILEADKRGGFLSGGGDTYARLQTAHDGDLGPQIQGWVQRIASYGGNFGGHSGHHGHRGHGRRHGHGGHYGGGAVAGGIAGGLLGGLVAGEIMGDLFD
jgi:sporulation-control protein